MIRSVGAAVRRPRPKRLIQFSRKRRLFHIAFNHPRAARLRQRDQPGRGVNHRRRAHHQQHPPRARHVGPLPGSAGSASPNQTTPGRISAPHSHRGGSSAAECVRAPFARAGRAAQRPDIAVDPDHVAAARPVVEAVHVLRHQRERCVVPSSAAKARWPAFGSRLGEQAAPPVIPFPNQHAGRERTLPEWPTLRPALPPQPARTAKGRNTALGGDARAGEYSDSTGFSDPFAGLIHKLLLSRIAFHSESVYAPPIKDLWVATKKPDSCRARSTC